MSRLVLVTGATGFAGSHLVEALLAAGHRVRVPLRASSNPRWLPAGVERVAADLRDPDALAPLVRGVSWILHFAGITRAARRSEFRQVNTLGTRDLYRAACAECADLELFVFCSSLAASGPAPAAEKPRRENDAPAPITAYGRSKLEAEAWLSENRKTGTRLLIVRPPAVYGPRDTATLALFRWAAAGILPLPAPRGNRLTLIHVRDLAAATLFLAEQGREGIFHVGDGGLHSWEKLGESIGRLMNRKVRQIRIPRALVQLPGIYGEVAAFVTGRMPVINRDKVADLRQPFWIASIDKLTATGYLPRIVLEEGLRETVSWYRAEGWL